MNVGWQDFICPVRAQAKMRAGAGAGLVLLLLAGPAATTARADAKIVAEITVKGQPTAPGMGAAPGAAPTRQTVTTYYKGNRVRTDGNGTIMLYDAAADTLLMLDPARKTYTVNAMQKMGQQAQPYLAMMKIDTEGSVRPGGATRNIAGLPARNYRIAMNMRMSMKRQASAAAGQMPSGPLMTMRLEGEQWASTSLKIPARAQRMMSSAMLRNMQTIMPGMKPLMDKMATIQGAPLSSRMTMTMTPARNMPGAPQKPMVMTTITEVRSVSQQTLPAALFAVPAGYRKVEPTAGMGTPGG